MKHILITGATSGIGMQLVLNYLMEGWQVCACGRQTQSLSHFEKKYQNLTVLTFDLTDKESTFHALSSIEAALDLIILNAGTCEYVEQGEIDSALFRRIFDANFFGILHCIEALQTKFTKNTHLALMGSTAAYLPFPRSEAYGASKAAVAYLANSLSVSLMHKDITVSLIAPGFVKTPLTDKNDFAMPMIISAEEASKIIMTELAKKKAEIHFPKKFSYLLKCLALLPINFQRKIMTKLIRK